jgi:hypothetical protein
MARSGVLLVLVAMVVAAESALTKTQLNQICATAVDSAECADNGIDCATANVNQDCWCYYNSQNKYDVAIGHPFWMCEGK